MTRFFGALRSELLAALLGTGLIFSGAVSHAQTTTSADGGYSVTDPVTGNVTYYDADGNFLDMTAVDPVTGTVVYYDASGNIMDPLHAFCWGHSSCSDNGTNTPVTQKEPDFGFEISPGSQTGDLVLDILVPDTDPHPSAGPTIVDTNTLPTATSFATTLYSNTPWTSGDLAAYLHIGASPANPIGAYDPTAYTPGANGFYVYQIDIGSNFLCGTSGCGVGQSTPLFTIKNSGLLIGSYIVGFLNVNSASTQWVATANSGALFDTPEPGTVLLLLAGVTGLFLLRRSEPAVARQAATKLS